MLVQCQMVNDEMEHQKEIPRLLNRLLYLVNLSLYPIRPSSNVIHLRPTFQNSINAMKIDLKLVQVASNEIDCIIPLSPIEIFLVSIRLLFDFVQ